MNGAHLHLILNHLPVVGSLFLLFVLIAGFLQRSPQVLRTSLAFAVLVGLAATMAYLSGEPAESVVEDFPGVSKSMIHAHEEMAELAFAITASLGLLGAVGLIAFRRRERPPTSFMAVVLALAVASAFAMAYTANLGGEIRHPEMYEGPVDAPTSTMQR